MSVSKFLKNTGWLALAASMVVTALPASAQDRRGDRGDRGDRGSAQQSQRGGGQGADRRQAEPRGQEARQRGQQAQQRAQQAQQRAAQPEQRAAQPARQPQQRAVEPARQAVQPARQGNSQGRQADRRAQQPVTQQASRLGDWQRGRQAQQPAQQVQRRPAQADPRGDQRAQQRQGDNRRDGQVQTQGRNTTYSARSRDNDRRDNNQWRDNDRRDNDRRGNNQWRDNDRRDNNQRWDQRWRDNSRYDWQRYRTTNRSIFRIGVYYSPYRSYSYRRLGVGGLLDSLFFGSRYWINDPWQYRLPEVYGPYRWVRYYDDVLLVDIYTGEVVDVIYDFFW